MLIQLMFEQDNQEPVILQRQIDRAEAGSLPNRVNAEFVVTTIGLVDRCVSKGDRLYHDGRWWEVTAVESSASTECPDPDDLLVQAWGKELPYL